MLRPQLQPQLISKSTTLLPLITTAHLRPFSTSPSRPLKEKKFLPPLNPASIVRVETTWKHPSYTPTQMEGISVSHRPTRNFSDKVAYGLMSLLRWGMDTATFYSHTPKKLDDAKKQGLFAMTERKWLVRLVFLESVAGVPGMVGGAVRHLNSLRRMQRDGGWIQTLLEEAYNERMHLLTFLKLAEPGLFMRTMILGAQGVFFNSLFFAYLFSPATVHRFVGYLEEEAVLTYTRLIADLDSGLLPSWSDPNFQIPDIAVEYWDMPEGKRTMRDLLLYVRADEAKHREVNHTLGNLESGDPNPYNVLYKEDANEKGERVSEGGEARRERPTHGLETHKAKGWERKDVI